MSYQPSPGFIISLIFEDTFEYNAMKRSLQYISMGRGGYVVYRDDISEIKFDYEFGGGDCIAIIFIPAENNWTRSTQRPLADRDAILQFVATQATRDQVSNGYFTLSDNFIEIYKR